MSIPNTLPQEQMTEIQPDHCCNSSKLRVGDKLSTTMFYSYVGPSGPYRSRLLNEVDGKIYIVDNSIVEKNFNSTQFVEEKKVCLTDAVKILQTCGEQIFEAAFATKTKP